ncbi:MAG: RluA family pseudouridine synthase [Deltaproteobacteria bacterium]|nr:RluA family pseudouridine synthase [Deltaproteobacteria bacterium]TLN00605.1 MAG: RluA family pseudouridine synthase [bacterium]
MILKETVAAAQAGMRLDDGAALLFESLSKTRVRRIVDLGGCTVNGVMVRVASRTLRRGDEIVLGVMEPERFRELVYTAESILYEDDEVVGICKPAGFNSQRTPYQLKGTVEYAIGVYLKCAAHGDPVRIIHRLDRGTSGVMLFPKNRAAAARLSRLLKEGRVEKRYLALVGGSPPAGEWLVDQPIAKVGSARYGVARPGKEAQTGFRLVAQGEGAALLEARPLTGRTHQIRVHLEHCGLPIVGDSTYHGVAAPRMMLHCRSMTFEGRDGRVVTVTAGPDDEFRQICGQMGVFGFESGDQKSN